MAEILTESFCERCGTRYTFQASAPRRQRLGKIKVLSKGLRKYVLDDSTSLDEALADARSDDERDVSSHQVEAFHQTFNFCLTCRQYTCANCWNEAEGRCLTCAPNLSQEALPAAFPALGPTIAPAPETNGHDGPLASLAWPTIDLDRADGEAEGADEQTAPAAAVDSDAAATDAAGANADAGIAAAQPSEPDAWAEAGTDEDASLDDAIAARLHALGGSGASAEPEATAGSSADSPAEVGAVAEDEVPQDVLDAIRAKAVTEGTAIAPEEAAATATPIEPPTGETVEPPPGAADVEPSDRAAAAAARTAWLLSQFRPAAASATDAAADAAGAPDEPPASDAYEPEASPAAAAEIPASLPVQPPLEASPEADTPRRDDRIEVPTWSVVAPAEPNTGDADRRPPRPVPPPAAPAAPGDTRWPTPAWPAQPEQPPAWARPAARQPSWPQAAAPVDPAPTLGTGASGLWAESSREVLAPPGSPAQAGVQACVSCGLPLSSTARFCRRCGSAQAQA
jgi:hypothetical protein